jgi:hypothetical protein
VSLLAVEFKTVLGLAKAEALKLARVAVNDFAVVTLAKFKAMDKEDRDEAIEAAKLRKASLESLNSVIPSLLDMLPITSSVITF